MIPSGDTWRGRFRFEAHQDEEHTVGLPRRKHLHPEVSNHTHTTVTSDGHGYVLSGVRIVGALRGATVFCCQEMFVSEYCTYLAVGTARRQVAFGVLDKFFLLEEGVVQ